MSTAEIRQKSIRTAQNMRKMGITKNDVVSFFCKSNHDLAPVVFGAILLGAAINPFDATYDKGEL